MGLEDLFERRVTACDERLASWHSRIHRGTLIAAIYFVAGAGPLSLDALLRLTRGGAGSILISNSLKSSS
jgi:hypothetical protein